LCTFLSSFKSLLQLHRGYWIGIGYEIFFKDLLILRSEGERPRRVKNQMIKAKERGRVESIHRIYEYRDAVLINNEAQQVTDRCRFEIVRSMHRLVQGVVVKWQVGFVPALRAWWIGFGAV